MRPGFGCWLRHHHSKNHHRDYYKHASKAQALEGVDVAIEVAAYAYLLASDGVGDGEIEELEEIEEHIQDLLAVRDIIATHWYLSHDVGAGRHEIDILEAYIYQYPETAFLALFRMHRAPFWQLVKILTQADRRTIGLLNLDAVQNPSKRQRKDISAPIPKLHSPHA